jgi:hypothetical protein
MIPPLGTGGWGPGLKDRKASANLTWHSAQRQPTRCPKAMPEADRYTLVVSARASRTHARPWSWEICRDGEPLPARLREDGYKTEHTATAAGRFALRLFLAGLAEEESKP